MIKKTKSSIIGLTALAVIICVSTTITLAIENHIDKVNAEECAHEHVEYYEAGVATTDKPGYRSHYACCNCHLAWADENKTRLLGRTADYGTELADRSKIDCYDIDWRGKTSATRYDFRSAKDVTQTLTFVKGQYDASKHCGETANDKVSYSWNYNGGNGICIVTSPCLIRFKTNDTTAYDNIFNDFKKLSDFDIGNIETSSLTNMQMMFAGVVKASEIKNITVMDTSSATTMRGMFYGNNTTTSAITELDLSNFDTSNVSNFHTMFYFQNSLKTIYVSDRFITSAATEEYSSLNMFYYASSIVGGKGTTYNTQHLDKEYARIDQGPDSSAPGYFTEKVEKSTVTWNYNFIDHEPVTNKFENGKVIPSEQILTPTDENLVFGGWFDDVECKIPHDFNQVVTKDMTLNALWTKSGDDGATLFKSEFKKKSDLINENNFYTKAHFKGIIIIIGQEVEFDDDATGEYNDEMFEQYGVHSKQITSSIESGKSSFYIDSYTPEGIDFVISMEKSQIKEQRFGFAKDTNGNIVLSWKHINSDDGKAYVNEYFNAEDYLTKLEMVGCKVENSGNGIITNYSK